MDRHPRISAGGLLRSRSSARMTAKGPGDTPSRRRIFVCRAGEVRAKKTPAPSASFRTLMRRAYRRPVTDADLQVPLQVLSERRARRRRLRRGHRDGACARCWSARSSCSASSRTRRASRRIRPIASAISSWRRGCRSSCGAAFRTTSCSTLAIAGKLHDPRCWSGRCGGCWPTRVAKRW